jgi:hypothetical protein
MNDSNQTMPALPHLTSEFFLWLWWKTEEEGGTLSLGETVGAVTIWVDERLGFRSPGETKVTTVVTGDRAAETLEAKAALYGGKVLHQLRLHVQRGDREFGLTLQGPDMTLAQVKLPQVTQDTEEEAIYDRLFLYGELCFILSALWNQFAELRVSQPWRSVLLPSIRNWVEGRRLNS